MKKFIPVYKEDGEYGKKGDIKKMIEAESLEDAYKKHGSDMGRRGTVDYLEIPEGEDHRHYKAELIAATEDHWEKDGFADVTVDPEDVSWTFVAALAEHYGVVVDATKVGEAVVADKTAQVLVKYNEMNSDVYAEMAKVFKTTKSDSATAFHETYKQMSAKPELFSSEGLLSDRELFASDETTKLYDMGDALDSDAKIKTYADRMMELVEAYGVYRIKRISQFRAEKAVIEGV